MIARTRIGARVSNVGRLAKHKLSLVSLNHRSGSLRLTSLGVVGVTVTVSVGSTASTVNLWVRPLGLGSLTGS